MSNASIVELSRQCAQRLVRGRSTASLDPDVRMELENQLGRFKIWAGHLGAFAPGSAAADHRLRNDEDIKEVLVQMLTRLKKNIQHVLLPPVPELEDDDESNTSTSGSSASTLSLDDASEAGSELDGRASRPSRNSVEDIGDLITRLYRLSTIIRKPASSNENSRVARYIEKGSHGQDFEDYKSHVRWQLKFRFRDASPVLIDRLVGAVIFRRKKLLYREHHQEKLNQGMHEWNAIDAPAEFIPGKANMALLRQKSPALKRAATIKSSSQTLQFSATEASSVNRFGLKSYPRSIAPSAVTRSAVARREQLDVPPPPRPGTSEVKEVLCPYCSQILEKEELQGSRWKRHVLKDIDPYICLFEDCNKPNECFKTVDDWLSHMQWQHTIVWSCQFPSHESSIFKSKSEFERHMRREHVGAFTESQLPILAQKSALPASHTLGVPASTRQGNSNISDLFEACPLCPFSWDGSDKATGSPAGQLEAEEVTDSFAKSIRDHLASHLELIALLSLPERDDLDDADSDKRQSDVEDNREVYDLELEDHDLLEDSFDELNVPSAVGILEEGYIADEYVVEKGWTYVLDDPRVRPARFPEQGQDPTLKEFVRRARYIQTISTWKDSRVPTILVHNPEGLEIWTSTRGDLNAAIEVADSKPDMNLKASTSDTPVPQITITHDDDYRNVEDGNDDGNDAGGGGGAGGDDDADEDPNVVYRLAQRFAKISRM